MALRFIGRPGLRLPAATGTPRPCLPGVPAGLGHWHHDASDLPVGPGWAAAAVTEWPAAGAAATAVLSQLEVPGPAGGYSVTVAGLKAECGPPSPAAA